MSDADNDSSVVKSRGGWPSEMRGSPDSLLSSGQAKHDRSWTTRSGSGALQARSATESRCPSASSPEGADVIDPSVQYEPRRSLRVVKLRPAPPVQLGPRLTEHRARARPQRQPNTCSLNWSRQPPAGRVNDLRVPRIRVVTHPSVAVLAWCSPRRDAVAFGNETQ